ncbi:MAG: hypothetical protein LC104_16945 [Bacteroidales bacterium]|nr:hypothetical protein [Bacteroidales bacterium]
MNFHPESPRAGDNFLRLAGFADGELAPHTRSQLEDWLESHPEMQELLRDQEQFSPTNGDFWAAVAPPEPTPAQWQQLQNQIAQELSPQHPDSADPAEGLAPRRRSGQIRRTVGVAVLTAAVLLIGFGGMTTTIPQPIATPQPPVMRDPLASIPTLNMARPDDVFVEAVFGTPPLGFAEYDSPLLEELSFATTGEVAVERIQNVEPGVQVSLCESESGMPMIYAAIQTPPHETP